MGQLFNSRPLANFGVIMISNISKQRFYASLLILGSCILLFRTIKMVADGSLGVLVWWVSVLLVTELLLDAGCLFSSISWWKSNDATKARTPLRFAASVVILHFVRVYIFVLGRVGPWLDFDVRPEHRALHATRWSWGGVYFAAIISFLSVIGLLIIWLLRRRAKIKMDN